jgi:hypothetical protein
VGNITAPFDRKEEPLWSPLIPSFEGLFFGETIKGDIEFHGLKILGVKFKPFPLRKIRGIENAIPPMGVIITTCPNKNHDSKGRIFLPLDMNF